MKCKLENLESREVVAMFDRLTDRPIQHVEFVGMNHFQFTDYVNPPTDVQVKTKLHIGWMVKIRVGIALACYCKLDNLATANLVGVF